MPLKGVGSFRLDNIMYNPKPIKNQS